MRWLLLATALAGCQAASPTDFAGAWAGDLSIADDCGGRGMVGVSRFDVAFTPAEDGLVTRGAGPVLCDATFVLSGRAARLVDAAPCELALAECPWGQSDCALSRMTRTFESATFELSDDGSTIDAVVVAQDEIVDEDGQAASCHRVMRGTMTPWRPER